MEDKVTNSMDRPVWLGINWYPTSPCLTCFHQRRKINKELSFGSMIANEEVSCIAAPKGKHTICFLEFQTRFIKRYWTGES